MNNAVHCIALDQVHVETVAMRVEDAGGAPNEIAALFPNNRATAPRL